MTGSENKNTGFAPAFFLIRCEQDLLFAHDLRANATRLSRAKTGACPLFRFMR